jgi:Ankyrin repeats (3 copies)
LKPSESLIIIDSLIRLGELRIAFETVESSTRAVTSIRHDCAQESVKHALKFVSWCIASQHDVVLSNVVALTERLDVTLAESALLRALRALKELEDCIESRLGSVRESQVKLQITIVRKLSEIYAARNDLPEAEYWLRRLGVLSADAKGDMPDWMANQLARSFRRTSRMARTVLDDLELDSDIRARLHFSKAGPCPAVHRAIRAGHVKVVRVLSNTPTAMGESDLIGRTPCHIAAEIGQSQFLNAQCIFEGIDRRDIFQCTPLLIAAYHGNLECLTQLVKMGADTEARTRDGRSALAVAASAGHEDVVQYLVEKGFDHSDIRPSTSSPHFAAPSQGHDIICRTLFTKGECKDCVADSQMSALTGPTEIALKEVSVMAPAPTNDQTMRDSGVLTISENSSEGLFDSAMLTPTVSFPLLQSYSLSCSQPDFLFDPCVETWDLAGFLSGDNMEFGTMQYPFEIA